MSKIINTIIAFLNDRVESMIFHMQTFISSTDTYFVSWRKFHFKHLFINKAYENREMTLTPYMSFYLSGLRSFLLNMEYNHSSKSVCSLSWSFYSLNGIYRCTRKGAGSVHKWKKHKIRKGHCQKFQCMKISIFKHCDFFFKKKKIEMSWILPAQTGLARQCSFQK